MTKEEDALKVIIDTIDKVGGWSKEWWDAFRTIEKAIKAANIIKREAINQAHPDRHKWCEKKYWGWLEIDLDEFTKEHPEVKEWLENEEKI